MNGKIALIYSFETSSWVSCHKIVSNLLLSYSMLERDYELIHLNYSSEDSADTWNSIKQASTLNLDYMIFLDHKPHPLHFLDLFFSLRHLALKTKLIFHIFGDFTLHLDKWKSLCKLLEKQSVAFFAASERQKNMLSEFIPSKYLSVCPFPVHHEEFGFNPIERLQMRDSLSIKDDETVFLYTGRLSFQKQIHLLIEAFVTWRKDTNTNARLILVGEPDAIGRPFEDRAEWNGEYFHRLLEMVSNLHPEERERIEFHGFKSNKVLPAYYSAVDYFINLSVHQDEDYGMSCAEALASGLPLILSDWAGFASFRKQDLEEFVQLIPVELSIHGPVIQRELIGARLSFASESGVMDRSKIRSISLSHFGISAAADIVRESLSMTSVFEGSTDFIHEAAYLEKYFSNNTFYDNRERNYNDKYLRMYKHYV